MRQTLMTLVVAGFLTTGMLAQSTESFPKAKLNLQVGEKKREVDATVKVEKDALIITDKKTGIALKTLKFTDVKSAEYSYSKSPRWKTAILVSPLFLFTSGKKHWFAVTGNEDYAVMQLDKTNYKMVLASFEARSGKKVETVTDTK